MLYYARKHAEYVIGLIDINWVLFFRNRDFALCRKNGKSTAIFRIYAVFVVGVAFRDIEFVLNFSDFEEVGFISEGMFKSRESLFVNIAL